LTPSGALSRHVSSPATLLAGPLGATAWRRGPGTCRKKPSHPGVFGRPADHTGNTSERTGTAQLSPTQIEEQGGGKQKKYGFSHCISGWFVTNNR